MAKDLHPQREENTKYLFLLCFPPSFGFSDIKIVWMDNSVRFNFCQKLVSVEFVHDSCFATVELEMGKDRRKSSCWPMIGFSRGSSHFLGKKKFQFTTI